VDRLMRIRSSQLATFVVLACGTLVALITVRGQTNPSGKTPDLQIQDAYSRHFAKIRQMLPPHSARPPLLDLTKSKIDDSGKDRAWEKPYDLAVRAGGIVDPGVPSPSQATSTATTFIDTAGRPDALPARICEAVVIGEPIASEVRISPNRELVYSRFSVKLLSVLNSKKKSGIREGAVIVAVQIGGSVRFPSGRLTTFVLVNRGFMELAKQYVLFIWKPPKSSQTYMAAEPYLIENGLVLAIQTEADASAYEGVPVDKFEAKVKSAIAQNIDTN
jgi:hypothetical protein